MKIISTPIICDGCGLSASPDHIAERVARLELATRFRPIHINTLFVVLAPMDEVENDFYEPPIARVFFDSTMDTAGIVAASDEPASGAASEAGAVISDGAKLLEFQHRGYYVSYLSECPIPSSSESANAAISRLSANLIRRIRFNYRPKRIVLLSESLAPLVEILKDAAVGPVLQLNHGQRLAISDAMEASAADGSGEALSAG